MKKLRSLPIKFKARDFYFIAYYYYGLRLAENHFIGDLRRVEEHHLLDALGRKTKVPGDGTSKLGENDIWTS